MCGSAWINGTRLRIGMTWPNDKMTGESPRPKLRDGLVRPSPVLN